MPPSGSGAGAGRAGKAPSRRARARRVRRFRNGGARSPRSAGDGRWGRTVAGRFAATFGDAIATPFASLTTLFPTAGRVAALAPGRIARLGMPGARARTVVALSRAVADGRLALVPNADIEVTLDGLRALPGVGEWTAQYIAMRALSWPDAFPHTDLGVMQELGETG